MRTILSLIPLGLVVAGCATPAGEAGAARPEEAAFVPDVPAGPLDYYLYVTAESADEVYLCKFDGTEATVEEVIPVGYQPPEIEGPHGLTVSPDGRFWFVSMAHGYPYGLLYKYTTGTNELVGQTELGLFPATMQISPATGLLYCVNFNLHGDMVPSTVSIVDPDAMVEVEQTTTGPMPHGSRISPDGMWHYSCSMMDGLLYEIDARTFEVSRTLKLDDASPHMHDEGMVDAAMQQAEMAKMSKPTWVFPHPSERLVYVCLNGADQVVEVDLDEWEIVRRFPTDKGPYNVEVTPDGKKLLVSYKSAAAVGIWDLENGVELARIPSSRRVTHGVVISPDAKYGFVSSEGVGGENGTLDVFDMETCQLVSTVELGLQAGGIAFWKVEPQM